MWLPILVLNIDSKCSHKSIYCVLKLLHQIFAIFPIIQTRSKIFSVVEICENKMKKKGNQNKANFE